MFLQVNYYDCYLLKNVSAIAKNKDSFKNSQFPALYKRHFKQLLTLHVSYQKKYLLQKKIKKITVRV